MEMFRNQRWLQSGWMFVELINNDGRLSPMQSQMGDYRPRSLSAINARTGDLLPEGLLCSWDVVCVLENDVWIVSGPSVSVCPSCWCRQMAKKHDFRLVCMHISGAKSRKLVQVVRKRKPELCTIQVLSTIEVLSTIQVLKPHNNPSGHLALQV